MKKEIDIDITALLDVLLIVLFAVLLNVNTAVNEQSNELEEIGMQLEALENEKASLIDENNQLSKENEFLSNELASLNTQLIEAENSYVIKYNNLETIAEGLSEWLNISEDMINEMIYTNSSIDFQSSNADTSDTNALIENIFKYEVITQKFVFIDLTVEGTENKVYINDQYTMSISSDEWYDESLRYTTIDKLSSAIDNYINNIDGGYSFILITYEHGDDVYAYVSNVLSNAIDDVRSHYQDEKILETEYILPNN
jgi:regulator of replication initiation timing